jgi:hypothetical protein
VSLNWTVGQIADWETVCYMTAPCDIPSQGITEGDRMLNPVTNALIWSTIAVDLPGITRENAAEFYARLRFTERLNGPMLIRAEVDGKRPEGEAAFITVDEVIDHIGLTANVTRKSRAAWLNHMKHSFDGDLNRLASNFDARFNENAAAYKD